MTLLLTGTLTETLRGTTLTGTLATPHSQEDHSRHYYSQVDPHESVPPLGTVAAPGERLLPQGCDYYSIHRSRH